MSATSRAALALVALAASAAPARAQSFLQEQSEDACGAAATFDVADTSREAEHARRQCRLQQFEARLAAEREQDDARRARAERVRATTWLETTEPARALRPIAVQLFVGTGLVSYGLAVSWDLLRELELAVHVGRRPITCPDETTAAASNCDRTSFGGGARWMLLDKDVTPFLAGGFALTSADLHSWNYTAATPTYLSGHGQAHTLDGGAGLALGVRGLRLSLEYIYEYIYYTGANLDDQYKTPSDDLRGVWVQSLRQDRHGVRFQAGYAF